MALERREMADELATDELAVAMLAAEVLTGADELAGAGEKALGGIRATLAADGGAGEVGGPGGARDEDQRRGRMPLASSGSAWPGTTRSDPSLAPLASSSTASSSVSSASMPAKRVRGGPGEKNK